MVNYLDTNCLDDAPIYDNKDHTVQEWNQYNPEESYCCLLFFKIEGVKIG